MALNALVSWTRTKIHGFFSRVIIPRLEVLLDWYLKMSGQRNVEKYWRRQLARGWLKKTSSSPVPLSNSSFDICVATVQDHQKYVNEISCMVNAAYVRELKEALLGEEGQAESAFSRTSPADIERRLLTSRELDQLKRQTAPAIINRVLFLAMSKEGQIIGTCAATLSAPWCPAGVGSWGLLAVSAPRIGVGRALVEHCERYISIAMLESVSIEYFFVAGVPSSEALRKWYEERLNYECFKAESTGRSYRGNEVRGEVSFRHCKKHNDLSEFWNAEVAAGLSEMDVYEARKKKMAKFLLAGLKNN